MRSILLESTRESYKSLKFDKTKFEKIQADENAARRLISAQAWQLFCTKVTGVVSEVGLVSPVVLVIQHGGCFVLTFERRSPSKHAANRTYVQQLRTTRTFLTSISTQVNERVDL